MCRTDGRTDGRTDRRTDGIAVANTALAMRALKRTGRDSEEDIALAPMCPRGKTNCSHLANTIEPSVCGGDGAYVKLF